MVPRKALGMVIQGYTDCKDFSALCLKRNGLLEEYKKQADAVIVEQEKRNLTYKDEIEKEKRKRNIYGPVLGVLGGIAAGFIYSQAQK